MIAITLPIPIGNVASLTPPGLVSLDRGREQFTITARTVNTQSVAQVPFGIDPLPAPTVDQGRSIQRYLASPSALSPLQGAVTGLVPLQLSLILEPRIVLADEVETALREIMVHLVRIWIQGSVETVDRVIRKTPDCRYLYLYTALDEAGRVILVNERQRMWLAGLTDRQSRNASPLVALLGYQVVSSDPLAGLALASYPWSTDGVVYRYGMYVGPVGDATGQLAAWIEAACTKYYAEGYAVLGRYSELDRIKGLLTDFGAELVPVPAREDDGMATHNLVIIHQKVPLPFPVPIEAWYHQALTGPKWFFPTVHDAGTSTLERQGYVAAVLIQGWLRDPDLLERLNALGFSDPGAVGALVRTANEITGTLDRLRQELRTPPWESVKVPSVEIGILLRWSLARSHQITSLLLTIRGEDVLILPDDYTSEIMATLDDPGVIQALETSFRAQYPDLVVPALKGSWEDWAFRGVWSIGPLPGLI